MYFKIDLKSNLLFLFYVYFILFPFLPLLFTFFLLLIPSFFLVQYFKEVVALFSVPILYFDRKLINDCCCLFDSEPNFQIRPFCLAPLHRPCPAAIECCRPDQTSMSA